MNELSPGASRTIAVAVLFVLLLVSWTYLLLPMWRYYEGLIAESNLKRSQLDKYVYLLANEERFDQALALLEKGETGGDLFLSGSKPAIASANLREFISEAIIDSGGELISSQEYEAESIEATRALGLELQVKGEVQELLRLLHILETARPVVFIDQLSIDSSNTRVVSKGARRQRVSSGIDRTLDVRLRIVGYLIGGELQVASES